MQSSNKETLSTFEVEAASNVFPEKIHNFFTSRSITLKEFTLKEKKESTIIYEAVYVSNLEAMTGLELIKVGDYYQGNDFKIIKVNTTQEYEEVLIKLLEEEKSSNQVSYFINYDEILSTNFMKAYGTEGLEYINQDVLKKQRSVMTYMIKKIGTNLLSGKSIMSVSLPIYIFDPRSVLEQMAFGYKYISMVENAAEYSNLERLKHLTVFCMAMLSTSIGGTKPFNPILGETFQCQVGENTQVYLEQTSHHPPIFNYYIKNPKFICFGHSEVEINTGANSMVAETKGKLYIKFNDGGLYRFYPPKFIASGLMLGKRYINMAESLLIEDITNNLYSVINFSREQKSFFGKMFGSSPKVFPDYVTGFIANKSDCKFDEKVKIFKPVSNDAVLSRFEGEWSHHMKCDNKEYWRNGEFEFSPMTKQSFTLPSDSRLRADVLLLKHGYDEYAQQAKMRLEDIQRNDRKLRKLHE